MEKLRIYACSILAIRNTVNDDMTLDAVSMHAPALIPAPTIQEASELCRGAAYKNWPTAEGWSQHQASIQPITTAFFEAAFNAWNSGAVGHDDEGEQVFCFDPGAEDLQTMSFKK